MEALPPTDLRDVWSPLHTVTREIHRPSHPSHCVRRGRTLGVAASATALTQRLDRRDAA